MSMLKYVLAFFAFIVVSLAPVHADEGYIPFFPDFLEPDGIGIRSSSIEYQNVILTDIKLEYKIAGDFPLFEPKTHFNENKEKIYSHSLSNEQNTSNSLFTFEYKNSYLYKKLILTRKIFEINNHYEKNIPLSKIKKNNGHGEFNYADYLTESLYISDSSNYDEINFQIYKDLISESEFNLLKNNIDSNTKRSVNFDVETKYVVFGYGIGLDLWFIEFSYGPYLMLHETGIEMKSCLVQTDKAILYGDIGEHCNTNSEKNIILLKKYYTGYSYGYYGTISLVFFESDNWKLTWGQITKFNNYGLFDFNGRRIEFRGLNIYPNIIIKDGSGEPDDSTNLRLIYYFR